VNALPGNGFQPLVQTYANASAIATADFNEDGILDLVAVDGYDSINFLLGHGDGTFLPYLSYMETVGASVPSSAAVGDLNGDGHADVVISLVDGDEVVVLLGKGDGTFLSVSSTSFH
jgi:hypothetical protein